ncbi:ion transporter [Nocardiopsis sp. HNM0947]|uniref:Ion transporter n=1 Tax=Nocardiopsis coralli TaxID=2772213 RepID=A0ABR9PDP2_9ACTN|nr:ion transporter [Nocardiopsis coralli]MBE3001943.1 ion transporter [Nocardiopsis coralli]
MVSSRWFTNSMLAVILVNAGILGAATYENAALPYLIAAERVIIAVFVVEMLLKLYAWRGSFFKNGWNWFDLFVVGVSLIPASGPFAVLRVLRVLRILRIITAVPQMRQVVSALFKSVPGMGTAIGLLLVAVYTFAILAQQLFGETVPEFFGDLGTTLYTLFMVMTTEDWPDVSDAVLEHHPMAWTFFVVYIVLTAFIVLNLVIGVIVASMEREVNDDRWKEDQRLEEEQHQAVMGRLAALNAQVEHLTRVVQDLGGEPGESRESRESRVSGESEGPGREPGGDPRGSGGSGGSGGAGGHGGPSGPAAPDD